ncbi:sigma-70 family RNA polymerase sigma factor [Cohnella thailandensis]|uniref:Sigma-70 family RNA polymerase sigma factor n=1 Tax=Cohnella thailandensis TaxID=557557 RepID=A0A841SN99_9BACL|nr:sigma-70 family RNA polymerase sigma factor [Cohnella thailandensis]MBB6632652.1 sigma-70 family RNA polymerase sigma factor [Cohnella thailandensis]MBP1975659.1 RNA polymerase sigma-70 factor (ECF subfamily) [Cohnella thailandensis]
MTTEEQVIAAQGGDDQAFYGLIHSERVRLFRIAYSYLKNEEDAIEAIQELTYRAYLKLGKLKEPRYFHTWLIRILIRYCLDERKRRQRMTPVDEVPEPLSKELNLDDRIQLGMEIENLKPNHKHVIILKYYEDMTLTEISRLLEKPEGTVKTWLNQALKQLRLVGGKGGGEHA